MKKAAAPLVSVLVSAALAACGGGGGGGESSTATGETSAGGEAAAAGSGGAESSSIVKLATPSGSELSYTTDRAGAEAGQVSIEFDNHEELQHDVAIEDSSGNVVGQTELVADGSATTTVDLKPGTYTFFCTVPGHREAGMEGTLTVK